MKEITKYLSPSDIVSVNEALRYNPSTRKLVDDVSGNNLLERVVSLLLKYEFYIRQENRLLHDIIVQCNALGFNFQRILIDDERHKYNLVAVKKYDRAVYSISGIKELTIVCIVHNDTRYLSPTDDTTVELFSLQSHDDYMACGTYLNSGVETYFEYHFDFDSLQLISEAFRTKDDIVNGTEFYNFTLYYVDPTVPMRENNHVYMTGKRLRVGFLPFEGEIRYFSGQLYQNFHVLPKLFTVFVNSYLNAYYLCGRMNLDYLKKINSMTIVTVRKILWSSCVIATGYDRSGIVINSRDVVSQENGWYVAIYQNQVTRQVYNGRFGVGSSTHGDPTNPVNNMVVLGAWIGNYSQKVAGAIISKTVFKPKSIVSSSPITIDLTPGIVAQLGPFDF